jgi:hypothetical protein
MARNNTIIGTWKLVSAPLNTLGGESRKLLGESPSGFATYTADGRMTILIASGGREPLSAADPVGAPAPNEPRRLPLFAGTAGDTRLTQIESLITWKCRGTKIGSGPTKFVSSRAR